MAIEPLKVYKCYMQLCRLNAHRTMSFVWTTAPKDFSLFLSENIICKILNLASVWVLELAAVNDLIRHVVLASEVHQRTRMTRSDWLLWTVYLDQQDLVNETKISNVSGKVFYSHEQVMSDVNFEDFVVQ